MQCHAIPYNTMKYLTVQCNGTICIFGHKTVNFRQLGPYNSLPDRRMGTYLKPKGIQSYLRIWGSYDPIGSNPSETKKGVLYECSVKNQIFGPFLAQKGALAPPPPPPQRPPCKAVNTKRLFFRCPVMIVTIFLRLFTKN